MDILSVSIRVLHVLSAILLMGGLGMMLMCVLPAIRQTDESMLASLVPAIRKKFSRIAMVSIGLLLLTGFGQWGLNHKVYEGATPLPNIVLGIKMLLAFAIFFIYFGMSTGVIKGCPKKWMGINFTLALLVVILAAVVRYIRLDVLFETFVPVVQ